MQKLSVKFNEHNIFKQLSEFYDSLSFNSLHQCSAGITSITNIDVYTFLSIEGTLESIKEILLNGRINDAYALLRKYYDSTIINVYANLYLIDKYCVDNSTVKEIDNWVKGTNKIPEYGTIIQYIRDSDTLKPMTNLLLRDNQFKDVRARCNDHVHYNFFQNLLLNNKHHSLQQKIDFLNTFSSDLIAVFIQHIAYLFYLNDNYMRSSDYFEEIENGKLPQENIQLSVAPFIEDVFKEWIEPHRPDIASEITSRSAMNFK